MHRHVAAAATILLAMPAIALAQSYRCVGADGKKYYGQTVPTQCVGQPVETLNAQGMVTKRTGAQATAAEKAQKEAEDEERKKRDLAIKEETRRNKALLATYSSEKDIEAARARALAQNQAAVAEIEKRLAGIRKRQADAQKERDAATKTKGAQTAPMDQDIRNAEMEYKAQEPLLAAKQKEVEGINARYDDDKRRYLELTNTDMRERASRTGEAKSVTVVNRGDGGAAERRNRYEADARARRDQMELRRLENQRPTGTRLPTSDPRTTASSGGTKTIYCDGTRVQCGARDSVMCGGRPVTCQ